ncbi:MAG: polynucleotide kinase-phosphatase [Rhodococcus sp. (in: high G+C Gram-positive bacteria)]
MSRREGCRTAGAQAPRSCAEVRRVRGGKKVNVRHGLAETLEELAAESAEFRRDVVDFCDGLVAHLVLDGGRLVVAHAGLKAEYHGRASGRVRSFALYGDTTGETDEFGLPVRYPWARDYRGAAMVLYGHTPVPEVEWINGTACLDTGCVFGGSLTALRYPEKELVSVPAQQVWYEPLNPLVPQQRPADILDVDDVLTTTGVDTRLRGRITIKPENAAGALEVMSRFAVAPQWLRYLPPTMAPCGADANADVLEHPATAFESYRSAGVTKLICEEKHMGSRSVLLICRDASVARRRFDAPGDLAGMIHTRTGRQFFDDELTGLLVERIAAAVTAIGLWDELSTDWILLDAELLPWSVKAESLVKSHYAAVGAAGSSDLAAQRRVLARAVERGLDVADLNDRVESRTANMAGFTAAYRRYVRPTRGLDGVSVAPFQVLASEGSAHGGRDHEWHLSIADRLCAHDATTFTPTRRVLVDPASTESVAAGVRWWEQLTASGSEGMVVKPWANQAAGRKAQPGIKVRGREYLRMTYGPDYTDATALSRLRERSLGHKRSMALREYALGMEGLARLVDNELLWRVHQAVFGVLALESEPVDPRL